MIAPDENHSEHKRDCRIACREASDRSSAAFLHRSVVKDSPYDVREATEGYHQHASGAGCCPSRPSDVGPVEGGRNLHSIFCSVAEIDGLPLAARRVPSGTHEAMMEYST